MTLHYLGSLAVYSNLEPRIVIMVRRVSDTSHIGTPIVWTARVPIERPIARTPRAWLQSALEQLPDLTTLK